MMRLLTPPAQKRTFTFTAQRLKIMPELDEFITTEQAAQELGFTVASVRNMIYRKNLPAKRFGRTLLIPKKSVKEYIQNTKGLPKNSPKRKQQ